MTEHTLTDDCPCNPEVITVGPVPTQRQMRTWLRSNAATTGIVVGSRGFLPADAVKAYRTAHNLPVE